MIPVLMVLTLSGFQWGIPVAAPPPAPAAAIQKLISPHLAATLTAELT